MNTDETEIPELTRRQEEILSLIVRAYAQSPDPVASKSLVDNFNLSWSAATVRNEMAVLEDLGYIVAPHTSAGRVPTESGYRYFVKRLMSSSDLTTAEQTRIDEKLHSLPLATEQWMRLTATLLARTAQSAALVTPPVAETSHFKHMELISIQGRLVLMVLVLQGGAVHQQMLTLAEPVTQIMLTEIAGRINVICADLTGNEVRMKGVALQQLGREVCDVVADSIEMTDTKQVRMIYRDGLSEVISAFQSSEGAQQLVRVFEERAYFNTLINEILTPVYNNAQVIIGGNNRWEELSQLSVILSRYGIPGQMSGAIAVLGPTHLNYGRAISAVRYVSNAMTGLLTSFYDSQPPQPEQPDES
jgi:heat-inducible transcriptional repressor